MSDGQGYVAETAPEVQSPPLRQQSKANAWAAGTLVRTRPVARAPGHSVHLEALSNLESFAQAYSVLIASV